MKLIMFNFKVSNFIGKILIISFDVAFVKKGRLDYVMRI